MVVSQLYTHGSFPVFTRVLSHVNHLTRTLTIWTGWALFLRGASTERLGFHRNHRNR